jgi:predicted glycogen debranching enzyme
MQLTFDQSITRNFEEAVQREWLETNGLGGYASSTLAGAHTRRYHGLLVAATQPPVGRQVLLSKLDETLQIKGERYELGSNQYPGLVHPQGYTHLVHFSRDLFPEFIYEAGGVILRKTVAAVHGENTTLLTYEVLFAEQAFTLELLPLIAGRDFHSLTHANPGIQVGFAFDGGVFQTKPYPDSPNLFISVPGATFRAEPNWYYHFEYAIERYRGQDFQEDLFTPGKFSLELHEGDTVGIIISTEPPFHRNAFALLDKERRRRESLLEGPKGQKGLPKILTLAADQFVVKRGEDLKTIIAGYHWFSDWGRDTMIALPGLCLVTGRFDDARRILLAFAQSVSRGMLPNRFPDSGETPEYNTVDATLWFFIAIQQYRRYTNDDAFIRSALMPVLKDILDWHFRGTRYGIQATEDGLLYAGEAGQQLTWMDARIGNWVVTPRQGKAVEVNALWYNALRIYAEFLRAYGQGELSLQVTLKAEQVKEEFNRQFWNEEKGCLYDYLSNDHRNDSIRPNQLFAISLPFALIQGEKARKVLQTVEEHLYTPVGLRSLSPQHVDYRPVYGGDGYSRDSAYHQGTVWSWLLGPYVEAILKVRGRSGRKQAREVLKKFEYHLLEGGVGSVSEIFDALAPHTPRGCAAQAWSVGEILRVALEHQLCETVATEKHLAAMR